MQKTREDWLVDYGIIRDPFVLRERRADFDKILEDQDFQAYVSPTDYETLKRGIKDQTIRFIHADKGNGKTALRRYLAFELCNQRVAPSVIEYKTTVSAPCSLSTHIHNFSRALGQDTYDRIKSLENANVSGDELLKRLVDMQPSKMLYILVDNLDNRSDISLEERYQTITELAFDQNLWHIENLHIVFFVPKRLQLHEPARLNIFSGESERHCYKLSWDERQLKDILTIRLSKCVDEEFFPRLEKEIFEEMFLPGLIETGWAFDQIVAFGIENSIGECLRVCDDWFRALYEDAYLGHELTQETYKKSLTNAMVSESPINTDHSQATPVHFNEMLERIRTIAANIKLQNKRISSLERSLKRQRSY